jgi:RHS repeat-associated protein
LVEETARGKTVRMEYDDITGSRDLVFPDGRRERTEHNPTGQPTRIILVTSGALGGTAGDVLIEIVYATTGRPVRVIYGNGVEGQLVYDELDRIIRIEYQKGGTLLDSCRLRYDEGGHRAVVQYLGVPARNLLHRFDGHERLVEARWGFPLAPLPDVTAPAMQVADVGAARIAAAIAPGVEFSLDDADTRTQVTGLNGGAANETYVSANDHRVTGVGASMVSYNTVATRNGDARYIYELDALNRVRRVIDRTTNVIIAELRYDALSRVAAGTTDGQEFERWFAGSMRIHEVSGPAPGASCQHSSHPLWPTPFCVTDAAGAAFIHQDEGWSTMCLTDASGSVLERHRYGVFGASATFAADGVTPPASLRTEPMWRGMPALGTTTLFRTPRRLYDPEIGVFMSRDPLLYVDSPSPHAYAAHNPVDFADLSGLGKSPLGDARLGPKFDDRGEGRHPEARVWNHDEQLRVRNERTLKLRVSWPTSRGRWTRSCCRGTNIWPPKIAS